MKKEIQITTPTDWSAITLKKYLELQKDVQVYGEEESGYVATLLYHLCDVTPDLILKLPSDVLGQIKVDLASFMGETDLPLKRFIKIDGVEYGFEPNLSTMEYGAYLDITRYETITIDDNWTKIMSVLYRPVKSKLGTTYEIETYNGYGNHEKFQEVGMDVHFGALFFFLHTLTDLVRVILNSMENMETLPQNIKSDLVKNGEAIKQLFNSQETISPSSILLSKNH